MMRWGGQNPSSGDSRGCFPPCGHALPRPPRLAGRVRRSRGLDECGEHNHADNADDGQPEPRL
jgi:hypothetical protein